MDAEADETGSDTLSGLRWSYRLDPALERRFADETGAGRNRQIRFWVVVGLAFSWLNCVVDAAVVPDMWWLAFLLRLCVVTPVSVAAIWLLDTRLTPGLGTIASVAPPASAILASLTCFAAATAETSTFLPGIVLALGILWVNVLVPLRFRDALMFTMLLLTLGAAINIVLAVRRHAAIENADVIVITLFLVALSLLARLLAERDLRGSFVLGLKLQARVEDLARSNQTLQEMSNTDPLTGLANRRFFDLSLAQAWQTAAAARSCIAMRMIDVDHFKLFNDTAGHLEGDRCLGAVARAIADHVRRGNDLAARFGGEEFVVLMPATDQDEAHEIAERIRIAIAALRVFHPGRIGHGFVSVSIGVAAMTPGAPGVTSTALLAAADDAMYAAKSAGRDRVTRAERPLPAALDVRMDIGRFACP